MKRILIVLLALLLVIPTTHADAVAYDPTISYEAIGARFWEDEAPPIGFYINASSRYLLETVTTPRMGSTYGEWSVMDLLRGMYTGYDYLNHIPANYFNDYLATIDGYVIAKEGDLDRNKSTEWSRLTLAMSALGKDIQSIGTAGDYLKVTTAKKEHNEWFIEANNISSLSSIKIVNQQMTVTVPVGVQTTNGMYTLLQAGTYSVVQNNDYILVTGGDQQVRVAPSQYVHLAKPYNFVERMSASHRFSYRQGINGPIWIILAMNTGNYQLLDEVALQQAGSAVANGDTANSIGQMIDYILKREILTQQGGWALTGNQPDADITGMALQAFAPYYLDEAKYKATQATTSYLHFKEAVERGVLTLKRLQKANGGYDSWGSINAESIVQVIVALTSLQMDPLKTIHLPTLQQDVSFITDGAFIDGVWTNNMLDALLTFFAAGSGSSPEVGGFKHVTAGYDGGGGSGTSVNAMATDQALYGLIAYDRFLKAQNSLYDMTDMINGEYKSMHAKQMTVTWVDGDKKTTQRVAPYALLTIPSSAKAWNTAQNFSGTRYMADEHLIMPEQNITLYADHQPDDNNPEAIRKIIAMIDTLPNSTQLTKDYKNQIDHALQAYAKLPVTAQSKVTNYAKLLELAGQVNSQLAQYDDELKVTNLVQTIASLQTLPSISRDYEVAITNARVAYNNLTAKQRQQITNRTVLDELEAALAVSLEMEQGKAITVATTQAAIDALPTVETVTLNHSTAVFKAAAYMKQLSSQQQSTLANTAKIEALIQKIRTLQITYLETEQFEDELADDAYGKLTVIGQTLHVTAPRTTGTFQVRIAVKTLMQALTNQVQQIIFSDVRGVQLVMNKDTLTQQLHSKNGEVILQVSQLDYASQQFTVQWRLSTGETLISPYYMKLTIPYSYFVNGQNIIAAQVVKRMETLVATSHITTENTLSINLLAGATYQFVHNQFSFPDVTQNADAADLLYLANRLIVNGRADGTYGPNDSITRGQFAGMVNRALGLQPTTATVFTDIQSQWYAHDVQALYEVGIIKGTSPTTFNPSGKLTRQQAAVMMVRILNYVHYPLTIASTGSAYADQAKISQEAQASVRLLHQLGIMSGSNGYFNPSKPLTRMQMAKILKRTLAIAELL